VTTDVGVVFRAVLDDFVADAAFPPCRIAITGLRYDVLLKGVADWTIRVELLIRHKVLNRNEQ
jgi:hypothetical protein